MRLSQGLPFFPTRRSSDLGAAIPGEVRGGRADEPTSAGREGEGARERALGNADEHRQPSIGAAPGEVQGGRADEPTSRSEEHTSELQSHSDLVCRLLLEKK